MSRIRAKDTGPEMLVRRMVHAAGYRYRLHVSGLPGKPDLVFSGRRKVIFVHGCFWHLHAGCKSARIPKTRAEFWKEKLEGNRARDSRTEEQLKLLGWEVLTVWECELLDPVLLLQKIVNFLDR